MSVDTQRGATIVELLVTAALVIVAVLIAGSLIVQAARLDTSVLNGLGRPEGDLAMAWIRRDVHAAAALVEPSVAWSENSLRLKQFSGSEVEYSAHAGQLERRELNADGTEASRRIVMRRVRQWRWRALTTRLLEAELQPEFRMGLHRELGEGRGVELPENRQEVWRALIAVRSRGTGMW